MAGVIDTLNFGAPNGSARYVALLTTMPNALGVGAVEASGNGYARALWSSWIDETIDGVLYRKNNGTIEFSELTGPLTGIVGYAIYDASSGGNLIAWGLIQNFDSETITKNLFAKEIPRFTDQELKIGADDGLGITALAPATARNIYRMAWSPSLGMFAALTSGNRIQTSPDGMTWTDAFIVNNGGGTDICWSEELGCFVAILYTGVIGVRVVWSDDGITWAEESAANTNPWQSVCYATWLNLFVAVASSGTNRVMTSPDGVAWTERSGDAGFWLRIAAAPEISTLVAVSSDGIVMYSTNGTAWTTATASIAGQNWADITWSPDLGLFVAIAVNNGYTMTSPDGINWTTRMLPLTGQLFAQVKWSPLLDCLIATSIDGTNKCLTSVDSITWTQVYLGHDAAYWNELNTEHPDFVVIAESNPGATLIYLTPYILNSGYAELDVVDEGMLSRLQALLPPGVAWPRDADTVMTALNRALAYGFARVKRRVADFIEELDPRTTYEMLADFERVYGLPDECAEPTTLAGRRAALQAKMLGNVDPSKVNFIAIADELGYNVNITEYKRVDIFTCESDCDASLYNDEWMFVWTLSYWPGDSDAQLYCALEHLSPDHTLLVDNPRAWRDSTLPVNSDTQWRSIVYAPSLGLLVAIAIVGTGLEKVAVSEDGETWFMQSAATNYQWTSVCWSESLALFVAVATSGANRVMTSPDGAVWTIQVAAASINWQEVIWVEELSLFVVVGSALSTSLVMTSPTGVTWTSRTVPSSGNINGVAYSPSLDKLIAVGGVGAITSANGITWTAVVDAVASANSWNSVAWSEELGLFVAVGASVLMTSPTGAVWTARTCPAVTYRRVRWVDELHAFIAVGNAATGVSAFSLDGITWESLATGFNSVNFYDLAYSAAAKMTVAVSSDKTTTRSIVIKERAPL